MGSTGKVMCRECGCEIPEKYIVADGDNHTFTQKQIIGMTKKLFGRYQHEYFCIPCMSAILEVSESDLWEKMHEFKESGCTLF